jgi:hypothetical protein
MVDMFQNLKIEAKFVSDFDREALGDMESPFVQCIMAPSGPGTELHKKIWDYPAHMGEISLTTKNFYVYYWILANDAGSALILEDDSELQLNVDENTLADTVKVTPPNFSLLQLGSCLYNRLQPEPRRKMVSSLGINGHCNVFLI